MDFLPLFFDLTKSTALVFGDTHAASRKIDLLLKAGCQCYLVAETLNEASFPAKLSNPLLFVIPEADEDVWKKVQLVVAATGEDERDEAISVRARQANLPVNVVNRADLSSFIFPSIIDRSPLIAAVSSSGELPILTRLMRSRLESSIPHAFGRLAEIAAKY